MRRPGVCGAAEPLLVVRQGASTNLKPLVEMLIDAGCEVRGDAAVQRSDPRVKPASDEDWDTEYYDAIITAKVVDGVEEAIAHIHNHGSHHTDAIVTEDEAAARKFLNEVDSACGLHNASPQVADGGEFGFGAEIGIATGKFHARGPVGAEQLTSFKYRVHGTGQTRPRTPKRFQSSAAAVAQLNRVSVGSQSISQSIPLYTNGMRVGLLGGSFNPPHVAHRAISLFAIKRLKLDRVWWLVTPGNPLKQHGALPDPDQRIEAARQMADDPRIDVSCLESVIGTRYTVDTITYLRRRAAGLRFVWIMGADNLAQFHRWENWRRIASEVPIAVIDRPPQSFRALAAPAAAALGRYRLPENQAARLADRRAPAWVFLTGMKLNLSSTGLRNPDGSWRIKKGRMGVAG